jgi:asparagine synthase (glutamine-hydrolysing)
MCGIVAIAGAAVDAERRSRALARLAHRGPDGAGEWSDGTAWLGHRRLAVIDLSEQAAQPMANEDGRIRLVFNGEIYNFPELRRELEARGHRFRSATDSEVIVHAYEEYGDRCVERLWGMFAFVIWDGPRRRLLAARDRFGKKPLAYIEGPGRFAAASEIPALLETGWSRRAIDLESLAFFWNLGYVPAPRSAFTDVRKLPAGHALAWDATGLKSWRYYPPREVPPFTGSYEEAREEFRALLRDAVRRRLVSDVPLGVALSGGLDSAAVTAQAAELAPGRLVTLTVRPRDDGGPYDEGAWALATATSLGTRHVEVRPDATLEESFEVVTRHIGEPFAIGSSAPCYYLFRAMKPQATVVLSGDGGDEMLAGYPGYRAMRALARARRLVSRRAGASLYSALDATYGALPAARPGARQAMIALQLLLERPPTDAHWEHRQVLQPEPGRELLAAEGIRPHLAAIESLFAESDPMRLRMLADQFDNMSGQILSKVDVTSMAHAVEVRSPLLDHRIAELARGLPEAFLRQDGRGKRLLRDTLAGSVPQAVLDKPKSGFGLPVSAWLAGEGRPWVLERLTAPGEAFERLVRRDRIPSLLERHARGRPDVTSLVLRLLALRLWIDDTAAHLG